MRTAWPVNVLPVALVFCLLGLYDGLGYLLGPEEWSSAPSLAAFMEWPGGARGYGALHVLTGAVLAVGLVGRSLPVVRVGLALAVGVWLANAGSVAYSYELAGVRAWGGLSKGIALAALAALILRRTPERGGERG